MVNCTSDGNPSGHARALASDSTEPTWNQFQKKNGAVCALAHPLKLQSRTRTHNHLLIYIYIYIHTYIHTYKVLDSCACHMVMQSNAYDDACFSACLHMPNKSKHWSHRAIYLGLPSKENIRKRPLWQILDTSCTYRHQCGSHLASKASMWGIGDIHHVCRFWFGMTCLKYSFSVTITRRTGRRVRYV